MACSLKRIRPISSLPSTHPIQYALKQIDQNFQEIERKALAGSTDFLIHAIRPLRSSSMQPLSREIQFRLKEIDYNFRHIKMLSESVLSLQTKSIRPLLDPSTPAELQFRLKEINQNVRCIITKIPVASGDEEATEFYFGNPNVNTWDLWGYELNFNHCVASDGGQKIMMPGFWPTPAPGEAFVSAIFSSDGGQTFATVKGGIPISASSGKPVYSIYYSNGRWLMGVTARHPSGVISYSDDDGATWTSSTLTCGHGGSHSNNLGTIWSFARDGAGTLVASGMSESGSSPRHSTAVSTDNGSSWLLYEWGSFGKRYPFATVYDSVNAMWIRAYTINNTTYHYHAPMVDVTDGSTFDTWSNALNDIKSHTYRFFSDMKTHGGTTIVVGNFGRAWRSTDGGISWAYVTTGISQAITAVHYTAGKWHIYARPNVNIYSADDGITWSAPYTHAFPFQSFREVHNVSENKAIAVGIIRTSYENNSYDGTNDTWFPTNSHSGGFLETSDGISWSYTHDQLSASNNVMQTVAYGNGAWTAGSLEMSAIVSSNAVSWKGYHEVTNTQLVSGSYAVAPVLTRVKFANGVFMGLAGRDIVRSSDGIAWTVVFTNTTVPASTNQGGDLDYDPINDRWVVLTSPSSTRQGAYSDDNGNSWTLIPPGSGCTFMKYADGLFVATRDKAIYSSTDGITWTLRKNFSPSGATGALDWDGINWLVAYGGSSSTDLYYSTTATLNTWQLVGRVSNKSGKIAYLNAAWWWFGTNTWIIKHTGSATDWTAATDSLIGKNLSTGGVRALAGDGGSNLVAVGDNGMILNSTNNGSTWFNRSNNLTWDGF